MMRIAGHVFEGRPSSVPCGDNEIGIGACFPNPISMETLEELQNATELEVLDNRTQRLVSSYHLTSWYGMDNVELYNFSGVALRWRVSWYDEADLLGYYISLLEAQNAELREQNADLTNATIELASIIGDAETSEMNTEGN